MTRVGVRRGGVVTVAAVWGAVALAAPAGAEAVGGAGGRLGNTAMAGIVLAISILVSLIAATAVVYGVRGVADLRRSLRNTTRRLVAEESMLPDDVVASITAAAGPNEVGEALIAAAVGHARAERAAVLFTDADRVVSRTAPGSAEQLTGDDVIAIDRVAAAIESARPARWIEAGPAAGGSTVAMLVVPLTSGERCYGVLVAARPGGEPFKLLELDLLCSVGIMASADLADRAERDLAERDLAEGDLAGRDRRRLDDDLVLAIEEHDGVVGYVMIDVDHLEQFGQQHGADAVDGLLAEISGVISANLRDGDVLYRFSGETVSVLLPGADAEETAEIAERLRAAVESYEFGTVDGSPATEITISVGTTIAGDAEPAEVTETADRALDEAKHQGRNRVVVGERG